MENWFLVINILLVVATVALAIVTHKLVLAAKHQSRSAEEMVRLTELQVKLSKPVADLYSLRLKELEISKETETWLKKGIHPTWHHATPLKEDIRIDFAECSLNTGPSITVVLHNLTRDPIQVQKVILGSHSVQTGPDGNPYHFCQVEYSSGKWRYEQSKDEARPPFTLSPHQDNKFLRIAHDPPLSQYGGLNAATHVFIQRMDGRYEYFVIPQSGLEKIFRTYRKIEEIQKREPR